MYILIIFQFSTCVLAGIGLNHYMSNIKKQNNINNISKIIGVIISLVVIIFIFKTQLIDFQTKNIKYFGMQNHEVLDPIRLDLINQGFYVFLVLFGYLII